MTDALDLREPDLTTDDILALDDPIFDPETIAIVTGAASGIGQATAVALTANDLTVVGTANVNAGVFETFTNEEVTPEAGLASAAVPNLFRGVELHGHLHWDGLFCQNPPVNDLMTVDRNAKPDELWVVQINPQAREGTPTSLEAIADRRNELAGNISLNHAIHFIEQVNDWIDACYLPEDRFPRTRIRRIPLRRAYHCSTKLDRTPSFIEQLIDLGERRAPAFLE